MNDIDTDTETGTEAGTPDAGNADARTDSGTGGETPPGASLRQCGRCRLHFPVPADIHPSELAGWWACPACSAAIIPGHRDTDGERSTAAAARTTEGSR